MHSSHKQNKDHNSVFSHALFHQGENMLEKCVHSTGMSTGVSKSQEIVHDGYESEDDNVSLQKMWG